MRWISFIWLSPFLTAIGKRMGIDAHYFAKSSSLVLLSHAVATVRGLVTGYLVARLFPKEMYGEYQFILSVSGALSVFGLPGLLTSVTRAWARDDAFSFQKVLTVQFRFCLVASVLLLLCIPFLHLYDREGLWPLFLAAAVIFPLPPIAQLRFGAPTVAQERFDISLYATILWSILLILATLFIIFFFQSSLLMFLAATCLPPVVYLYFARNMSPPRAKPSMETTQEIIDYGWRVTVATIPTSIVWYIDKLLISYFFGMSQLALFSVALLIPEQIKMFVKQLLPVTFARQAKGPDTTERRRKLIKATIGSMAVLAIGIGMYMALSPFFMPLLFPQYETRSMVLLTSIAAASLLSMPGSVLVQYLEAQGMLREIQRSHWMGAGLFGISLITLIPLYGVMGAMLARGIFRFTYLGCAWWYMVHAPLRTSAK